MNDYTLYRNMKRWLFLYGSTLLDLIIPVYNEFKDDPTERYRDLKNDFDTHFNLLAFFQTQIGAEFPAIMVSFDDITGRKNLCFKRMRVTFDVYFSTISPVDCKDEQIKIINSPEAILSYQEKINRALEEMICSMDDDLRHEVFDNIPWEYPINYNYEQSEFGHVNGFNKYEVLHFQTSFIISDNWSCC